MKNLGDMMKQARELQGKMEQLQTELETLEVQGSAGGGMVNVTMTGKGEMTKVAIDPSLMKEDEREILEDLIVAASADAKGKAERAAQEKMKELTGGLQLPPGLGL
ncbi:YbaB/EbfC family nucleoid-associated protein [Parvibaculum sp.]|uniref:YbaB/EbfC family nucleoid-associated protein n=1 Tax=Parvibaculum sp. TaxID=2024848 RepID=UPI0025EF1B39|nr:YbaB/EbfC family nucleoid-associated protein [Parvibaculum sp.]